MNEVLLHELKEALTKEHDTIVSELKEIASPNPALKGDWQARYPKMEENETGSDSSLETEEDEVEEYETLLEAEHSLESRLLQIVHALHRIQTKQFGICPKCKKEIPIERLRANPAAEFCVLHTAS